MARLMAKTFLLGTHRHQWLWSGEVDFRLFISHNSLTRVGNLRPAIVEWAMDSGAYSELDNYGQWRLTPRQFVRSVADIDHKVGNMMWAAPMDMMCEPWILKKTGLTAFGHQMRTVINFRELIDLWPEYSDADCPFMPVLQAKPGDADGYLDCAWLYEQEGIDLSEYQVVGVGSVCRIQRTNAIRIVAREIGSLNLPLHYFGLKTKGLPLVWKYGFSSFDSMSWSFNARRRKILLPGCEGHINCANCVVWAKKWRKSIIMEMRRLDNRSKR